MPKLETFSLDQVFCFFLLTNPLNTLGIIQVWCMTTSSRRWRHVWDLGGFLLFSLWLLSMFYCFIKLHWPSLLCAGWRLISSSHKYYQSEGMVQVVPTQFSLNCHLHLSPALQHSVRVSLFLRNPLTNLDLHTVFHI